MGAVYLAERDDREYRMRVAIKVLRSDLDSGSVAQRFRQERQILAELEHPNIARLLDGGSTDGGVPYFVMEHVEGVPIDAYCEARQLSLRQRLELFRTACAAVAHAHGKRVVHRDLKPGNILVTAEGTPKLLDFGIAKLLIARPASEHTVTGTRVMTPEYASPEQWRGSPVTAASDVYSLGVVLDRLLTGRGPYRPTLSLPDEIGRAICEDDPEPPSAAAPQARHRLAGDVDAIVLKALRKEPERRYGSAEELSEDIRRHLEGRPVTARRDRLAYRADRLLRRNKAAAVTALTTAALAALVAALVYHWARATGFAGPTAALRTAPKSLAVLPFRPLERGVADPYLALGMADAIITRLGHVHGVVVRPTGSILKYVDSAADPLAAGRELKVDELVEGRFQHVGDRIRVTVQLLDLRDGASLWADTFDQQFQDVFTIQDVMSERIAQALVANLTREEQERLRRRYTADIEAYGFYLRGRYFWSMRTRQGLEKAVESFRRAVEKDPGYALAWGGLADCYVLFSDYSVAPSRDAFPKAIEAATKALSLDDSLAEPHIALAYAKYRYEWDWPAAEREFARGIELNPSYATGLHWYSEYLVMMGRWEEALAEIRRAQELDPLSLIINADEGWYLYLARRGDEAIAHLQKTLEMRPDFAPTHFYLGQAYELAGRYDEAIAEKAYDARSGSLVWIDTSDQWKELRSDPRFQDLLRRIGLPPAVRESESSPPPP